VTFDVTERPAGLAWHVVHCIGRQDSGVLSWLDRLGVEYYYPMIREMRPAPKRKLSKKQRRMGLRVPHIVPLLPRYTFIRFDMSGDGWRELFRFAGVGGMVCEGDLPVRVPEKLIASIKCLEINGAIPGRMPARKIFTIGERVRIADGGLTSFEAVITKVPDCAIEEVDSDTRIRVAVDLFGGETPVDLTISQIEKL